MKILTTINNFKSDQRGTVAILWAISLVAVLGLTAAAFEIGKISTTHSELQSFVDNVAIAAAGELDGNPDAIDRAVLAANNLISDYTTWGVGGDSADNDLSGGDNDFTLNFHATLPNDDRDPLGTPLDPDEDSRIAVYAEVTATPRSIGMTILQAVNQLLGQPITAQMQVSATAVAGFTQAACDITPLMFCLPEDDPLTVGVDESVLEVRDMMRLRTGGGGADPWGPGNFGFIDLDNFQDTSGVCADEHGNTLACLLAAQNGITQCIIQRGLDTEPGQKVGITNSAFNVRFDIFRSVLNGERNNPDFAPAPNVIKGIMPSGGSSCIGGNEVPTGDTMALPRDDCFATGCGVGGIDGPFGSGNWDRAGYLNTNHDLADGSADGSGSDTHLPALSGVNAAFAGQYAAFAGSRYGMYLREIAYSNLAGNNTILDSSLSESGLPVCSNVPAADLPGPERRLIIAAGVDCGTNPVSGSSTGVPVDNYVQVFLTEPVGEDGSSPPGFDIYGEVVAFPDPEGSGTGGSGGIFRDVVQLYR